MGALVKMTGRCAITLCLSTALTIMALIWCLIAVADLILRAIP